MRLHDHMYIVICISPEWQLHLQNDTVISLCRHPHQTP